jgi:signal recognition particle subunit SEC65
MPEGTELIQIPTILVPAEYSMAQDDWPYPVQWWNGSHGVSVEAVEDWFPNVLTR